jgi:hypothetical protein
LGGNKRAVPFPAPQEFRRALLNGRIRAGAAG